MSVNEERIARAKTNPSTDLNDDLKLPTNSFSDAEIHALGAEYFSRHEGASEKAYLDGCNHPTIGIGHLIFRCDWVGMSPNQDNSILKSYRKKYISLPLTNKDGSYASAEQKAKEFDDMVNAVRKGHITGKYKEAFKNALPTSKLSADTKSDGKSDMQRVFDTDFNYFYSVARNRIGSMADNLPVGTVLHLSQACFQGTGNCFKNLENAFYKHLDNIYQENPEERKRMNFSQAQRAGEYSVFIYDYIENVYSNLPTTTAQQFFNDGIALENDSTQIREELIRGYIENTDQTEYTHSYTGAMKAPDPLETLDLFGENGLLKYSDQDIIKHIIQDAQNASDLGDQRISLIEGSLVNDDKQNDENNTTRNTILYNLKGNNSNSR